MQLRLPWYYSLTSMTQSVRLSCDTPPTVPKCNRSLSNLPRFSGHHLVPVVARRGVVGNVTRKEVINKKNPVLGDGYLVCRKQGGINCYCCMPSKKRVLLNFFSHEKINFLWIVKSSSIFMFFYFQPPRKMMLHCHGFCCHSLLGHSGLHCLSSLIQNIKDKVRVLL